MHSQFLPGGSRSFRRLPVSVAVLAVKADEGQEDKDEQDEANGDVRNPEEQSGR